MTEVRKELERLLKKCQTDKNSEYIHRDFLIVVAHHFVNWQKKQMLKNIKKGVDND